MSDHRSKSSPFTGPNLLPPSPPQPQPIGSPRRREYGQLVDRMKKARLVQGGIWAAGSKIGIFPNSDPHSEIRYQSRYGAEACGRKKK